MTENKRMCISIPAELERRILELRKTDQYCRKFLSEIVRMLIMKGLEEE